jgi:hypothetical protein
VVRFFFGFFRLLFHKFFILAGERGELGVTFLQSVSERFHRKFGAFEPF